MVNCQLPIFATKWITRRQLSNTYNVTVQIKSNFYHLCIIVPTVSKLVCLEAVVNCVGKPWIFIQYSCLIAPLRGYESALWRTRMLLPNGGRKIADWLVRGFIQCANIQVHIARSITASLQVWQCHLWSKTVNVSCFLTPVCAGL